MTLTERMRELVQACFSGIWIESHEHTDAIAELGDLCRGEDWNIATWDIDAGLRSVTGTPLGTEAADPLAAVRSLGTMATDDGAAILVVQNFHRFLGSPEIIQAVAQAIIQGKSLRTILVVLSPVVQLPVELEKLFVVVEHALPDRQQLQTIATEIATGEGELPTGDQLAGVIDAAAGLTRHEAENAFALSLVRHQRLESSAIWELKTQTLKKSGTLTLHREGGGFETLGGLASLKASTRQALRRRAGNTQVRPKGLLLLSPPGCGKSQFCKTLGRETGRPVIILDVGSLLGSLVGQSEQRTRQALATIDAMAPCIVMIDEVEKAFAGASGGGQNDSGVSSRMFGTFLTWLNDHESDVFVVCTANDVQRLPPEFSRAERFDAVFFLDLPGREQKDAIWSIYRRKYGIVDDQRLPADDAWTGAEIQSCCRLAALLNVPLTAAAENIVPVSTTSAESIDRLRTWADGRCLSADRPGVFRSVAAAPKRRRGVSAKPSFN